MILLLFATQGEEQEGTVYVGTSSGGASYSYYYRG